MSELAILKMIRRCLLNLLVLAPCVAACTSDARADGDKQRRFKGIGIVLVDDAVPGSEMRDATFSDDRGVVLLSPALVSRANKKFVALGSARVPLTVRVIWRSGAGWDDAKRVWNKGEVEGDYTIPVADRIPEEVLSDIRSHGGALRLKFRLKPDGVLLGWDIERSLPIPGCDRAKNLTCNGTHFFLPGGDFLETRY